MEIQQQARQMEIIKRKMRGVGEKIYPEVFFTQLVNDPLFLATAFLSIPVVGGPAKFFIPANLTR